MADNVSSSTRAANTKDWIARGLLLAGVVYSLLLAFQVPGEVFFNGDGGMKFLLARQFLAGQWGADIRPPEDPLVQELWRQGYGPFKEPFVYVTEGRFVQCFPIYFSLLTAPFYGLFGFRGLYLVPLISLWGVWLRFWWLSRRLGLSTYETTPALVALVFASPLTLYGATYWEHTLAVALAFCGIAELIPALNPAPRPWRLVVAGVLLGLAGWLRPENICFAAAWLAAWIISYRAGGMRNWAMAAMGAVGALAVFFALNQAVYGHPLGAHSFSVIRGVSFWDHLLRESLPLLPPQCLGLLLYMPPVLLIVPLGLWHWFRDPALRHSRLGIPLVAVLLYFLAVPVIIDHIGGLQWGPRYLLSAVPPLCLIGAFVLQNTRQQRRGRLALGLFALLIVLGMGVNSGLGWSYFSINYHQRVWPLLQLVQQREEEFVVVTHQHVALELTSLWNQKRFLRAEDADGLMAVADALQQHGVRQFLLLHEGSEASAANQQGSLQVQTRPLGQYGRYLAYEAQIMVQGAP